MQTNSITAAEFPVTVPIVVSAIHDRTDDGDDTLNRLRLRFAASCDETDREVVVLLIFAQLRKQKAGEAR